MTRKGIDNPIACVVDLFCGVGGLSRGLADSGLSVVAGFDSDADCRYAYERNNLAKFYLQDVHTLEAQTVSELFPKSSYRVLSGCAPCQPFSRYGRSAENRRSKWSLLQDFGRIAVDVRPDIVTMENVPEVTLHPVFDEFVVTLEAAGYSVAHSVLYGPEYGVPQSRKRLVLLASQIADIELPVPTHTESAFPTVRTALSNLLPINAGEADRDDSLHRSCKLSTVNLKRIKASKPGGTWRDWPSSLRAKCHLAEKGATYPAVYGRMQWDAPSPTITTQFFGYGNGRFGHPDQDRALSLREGALLQSFPADYEFVAPGENISAQRIGKLIGNAVPVRLGEAIGNAIIKHIAESNKV